MESDLKPRIRFDLLLAIYTTLSPSIVETEIFGSGIHTVLDAVVIYTTITSGFWTFVGIESLTLGGTPDSMQLFFPTSAPILTSFVWAIGIISTAVVLLVLRGRLSHKRGFMFLIITTLLPFVVPGILWYSVESFHTYRRIPLPIPQIVGFPILFVTRNGRLSE